MDKFLLIILLFSFSLFSKAKDCIPINELSIKLDNKSNIEDAVSKFKIYHDNTLLFSYDVLGIDNSTNNVAYSDLDFDGRKEVVLRVDNDPSHDSEYAILKLICNKIVMHPLFPEVKSYSVLDNKKTKIYYKDGYSITEKIFCFEHSGYLCEEKKNIENGYEIVKLFSQSGEVIASSVYHNKNKLIPTVKNKSYLYYDVDKKSNMYLIRGDLVSILDERITPDGQSWFFINYKGKKNINMWIKADAINLN